MNNQEKLKKERANNIIRIKKGGLKMVIKIDGKKTTTARLEYENPMLKGIRGVATCHDDDKYDSKIGIRLAMQRLLKIIRGRIVEEANRHRRKFDNYIKRNYTDVIKSLDPKI